IVQTNDPRLLDARPPLAGSIFYIQNTNIPQSASLAITGDATVGGTVSGNVVTGYLQATSAASAPASCTAGNRGQMYFNTSTNQINVCNGSTWGASSGAPANSSGSLLAITSSMKFRERVLPTARGLAIPRQILLQASRREAPDTAARQSSSLVGPWLPPTFPILHRSMSRPGSIRNRSARPLLS